MAFRDGADVQDVAAVGTRTICRSVYPSPSCRCQLPAGHDGPHRANRDDDPREVEWDDDAYPPQSVN